MNFFESIRACFLNFANFKGRATRSEFWWFQLFCLGGGVALGFVDESLFQIKYEMDQDIQILAMTSELDVKALLMNALWDNYHISNVFFYATLIPSISVMVRRFHDIGLSGWRSIGLIFVPFAMSFGSGLGTGLVSMMHSAAILGVSVLYLYWLTKKSDPFDNKFGVSN